MSIEFEEQMTRIELDSSLVQVLARCMDAYGNPLTGEFNRVVSVDGRPFVCRLVSLDEGPKRNGINGNS
jgi:hypothetical protein